MDENESAIESADEELELDLSIEEAEQDSKEEAPRETPEAKKARLERQLAQINKKLGVEPSKDTKKSSDGLDYAQKAFLIASGIKGTDETTLVQDYMKDTGKTLDEVVESKRFMAELKDLRDDRSAKDAIPNGSKRSQQSTRDTVDYWLSKGELPPVSQRELRLEVVNARIKRESSASQFTNNPVG